MVAAGPSEPGELGDGGGAVPLIGVAARLLPGPRYRLRRQPRPRFPSSARNRAMFLSRRRSRFAARSSRRSAGTGTGSHTPGCQAASSPKRWATTWECRPSARHRASRSRREREIVVGVLDHRGADETARDHLLKVRVALVSRRPVLGERAESGPGSENFPKWIPRVLARRLIGERVQGCGPGNRRVRRQHRIHHLGRHARRDLLPDGDLERGLLG